MRETERLIWALKYGETNNTEVETEGPIEEYFNPAHYHSRLDASDSNELLMITPSEYVFEVQSVRLMMNAIKRAGYPEELEWVDSYEDINAWVAFSKTLLVEIDSFLADYPSDGTGNLSAQKQNDIDETQILFRETKDFIEQCRLISYRKKENENYVFEEIKGYRDNEYSFFREQYKSLFGTESLLDILNGIITKTCDLEYNQQPYSQYNRLFHAVREIDNTNQLNRGLCIIRMLSMICRYQPKLEDDLTCQLILDRDKFVNYIQRQSQRVCNYCTRVGNVYLNLGGEMSSTGDRGTSYGSSNVPESNSDSSSGSGSNGGNPPGGNPPDRNSGEEDVPKSAEELLKCIRTCSKLHKNVNIFDDFYFAKKKNNQKCFGVMENISTQEIYVSLSGGFDVRDPAIRNYFSGLTPKQSAQDALDRARLARDYILKWPEFTNATYAEMNMLINRNNGICVQPKWEQLSYAVANQVDAKTILKDFSCCERKIMSKIPSVKNEEYSIFTRFEACQQHCSPAITAFRNDRHATVRCYYYNEGEKKIEQY